MNINPKVNQRTKNITQKKEKINEFKSELKISKKYDNTKNKKKDNWQRHRSNIA